MTIKIAHMADTHLGYKQYGLNERENDFYKTFEKIIDDIKNKKLNIQNFSEGERKCIDKFVENCK